MASLQSSAFTIEHAANGAECRVRLAGRLDATTQAEAERVLGAIVAGGARKVLLDCSALEFISSAGMRALIGLVRSLKPLGGSIAVCAAPPPVRQALEFSGLRALLGISDSVADGRRLLALD